VQRRRMRARDRGRTAGAASTGQSVRVCPLRHHRNGDLRFSRSPTHAGAIHLRHGTSRSDVDLRQFVESGADFSPSNSTAAASCERNPDQAAAVRSQAPAAPVRAALVRWPPGSIRTSLALARTPGRTLLPAPVFSTHEHAPSRYISASARRFHRDFMQRSAPDSIRCCSAPKNRRRRSNLRIGHRRAPAGIAGLPACDRRIFVCRTVPSSLKQASTTRRRAHACLCSALPGQVSLFTLVRTACREGTIAGTGAAFF
jgi:hypothetical protein